MQKRGFTNLPDSRLIRRGNKNLDILFRNCVHSIRQLSKDEAEAKGFYRFLSNNRVTEESIISNLTSNCQSACHGKYVVCIQDTTEINLSSHKNRIKKDSFIGTTNAKGDFGLGFMLHPSLVLDAVNGTPYGYADIKLWNRPLEFRSKFEREYSKLPITEKESYKWIESSNNTKTALSSCVEGMVIIQDREGDIYEQFAVIPDEKTDLLIRAKSNRRLKDKSKLFDCLSNQEVQDIYEIVVEAKEKRPKRKAKIEIRYKEIEVCKTGTTSKELPASTKLYLIEAKEVGYSGADKICWRLLTTIAVTTPSMAKLCIEWYSWRWTIEEVFRILKKEGYNIEASELEYASSIRKQTLMIMEVVIKLFLMRLAYAEPELSIDAHTCFNDEEQLFMEEQIIRLEGKTQKQKNPYKDKDLKRYVWGLARMGGWKGYESKRTPGITTIWIGLKYFRAAKEGWDTHRDLSTR
ncbi:IS4 family transposase [Pedobacter sp. MW01-1-1]|uniref:IS4 family transposase n=1 Tax=Pedobacter sp. MW01-1-1 TaxID=3383027 RepID=UPI003FED7D2F